MMRKLFIILVSVLAFIVSLVCVVPGLGHLFNWLWDADEAIMKIGGLLGSEAAAVVVLLLPLLVIPYVLARIVYAVLSRHFVASHTYTQPELGPKGQSRPAAWESQGAYRRRRFLIAALFATATAFVMILLATVLIDVDPTTSLAGVLAFILFPFALPIAVAAAGLLALIIVRRRGCNWICRHCSYDLTGNVSGVCPECGTRIPDEQKNELAAGRSRDAPQDLSG